MPNRSSCLRVLGVLLVLSAIFLHIGYAPVRAQEATTEQSCEGLLNKVACAASDARDGVDVSMPNVNVPDVNMPDVNVPDVNLPDGLPGLPVNWQEWTGDWPPKWWPETMPSWLTELPDRPTQEQLDRWVLENMQRVEQARFAAGQWAVDTAEPWLLSLTNLASSKGVRDSAMRVMPRVTRVACAAAMVVGGPACVAAKLIGAALVFTIGLDAILSTTGQSGT